MKNSSLIKKSFLSGILISICGFIYVIIENKYLGSFLFSLGLYYILVFDLNLYTGKIGYMLDKKNYLECFLIFVFNILGCIFMGLLLNNILSIELKYDLNNFVLKKLDTNLFISFIKGFLCGFMIYIAVSAYKKNISEISKLFIVVVAIMIFILSGFEHSIALMFYLALNLSFNLKSLILLLVVAISNGIGSIFFHYILKERVDNNVA